MRIGHHDAVPRHGRRHAFREHYRAAARNAALSVSSAIRSGDYSTNKQNQVDDYPYGGGRGCVMTAQPLYDCWKHICDDAGAARPYHLYVAGGQGLHPGRRRPPPERLRPGSSSSAVIMRGSTSGLSRRASTKKFRWAISSSPAAKFRPWRWADAVCRLVPGVLPDEECYIGESHWDGLLEYPQYTRPEVWEGTARPGDSAVGPP